MSRSHVHAFACLAMALPLLLLAACAPTPVAPPPQAPAPSVDALIAAIAAAGKHDQSVVNVAPLRNPVVTKLLAQARQHESTHHYKAAADLLDRALQTAPRSPGILQDRAELAIRLGDYAKAEQLARRSFTLGPKVGSLCARNWQTVVEMRGLAHDVLGVKTARKHLAACEEPGPVRM